MFGLPDANEVHKFTELYERLVVAMERMVEIMEQHLPEEEEEDEA